MTWIIAFLLRKGVPERFVKPLLIGMAFVAAAGLLWAAIAIHDRNVVAVHDEKSNTAVIAKTTPANDKASDQRSTDTIALDRQDKDRHDEIHSVPDAAPAAPSVRLGCKRLRDQGTDTSKLSACR